MAASAAGAFSTVVSVGTKTKTKQKTKETLYSLNAWKPKKTVVCSFLYTLILHAMTDSATRAWNCCEFNIPYLGLFPTAIRNVIPKEGQPDRMALPRLKTQSLLLAEFLQSFAVFTARWLCCPDKTV